MRERERERVQDRDRPGEDAVFWHCVSRIRVEKHRVVGCSIEAACAWPCPYQRGLIKGKE